MGRMIDADALMKRKQEEYAYHDITDSELEDLINSQPTAYDVEKVVAELEKRSNDVITNQFAFEDDDHYGICNIGKSEGYDDAIEIVKRGGVE